MSKLPKIDEAGACLDQAVRSRKTGYLALSLSSRVKRTTLHHRDVGRLSKRESDCDKQYLTVEEEQGLVKRLLPMVQQGHRYPDLFLRTIAQKIRHKRNSISHTYQHDQECNAKLPGKNWPRTFRGRHHELHSAWMTSKNKRRHGQQKYDSVDEWLELMEPELDATKVLVENTYHVIATGVALEFPSTMTELMENDAMLAHLVHNKEGTVITAIECAAADGLSLEPWIIWPTQTHRRNWGLPSTSGWHHDQSQDGYLDRKTTLAWIKGVFEPQTAPRASGRQRLLIGDAITNYNTRELRKFCQEKRIRLCQLHSLASQKLQPQPEDFSEQLQIALRSEFNRAYSRMKSHDKSLFTRVYSVARQKAFEVLITGDHFGKLGETNTCENTNVSTQHTQPRCSNTISNIAEDFKSLRKEVEDDLACEVLNETTKERLTGLFDMVENFLASQGSSSNASAPLQQLTLRKHNTRS